MKKLIALVMAALLLSMNTTTALACNRSCECCTAGALACTCGKSGVGYITSANPDASTASASDNNNDKEELLAEFTTSGGVVTQVTKNTVTQGKDVVAVGDFFNAGPEDDGGKVEFSTFVVLKNDGGMGLIYYSDLNGSEVELFSGGHFVMSDQDNILAEAEGVEKIFFDGEILHIYTRDAESVQDSGIRWVVWHDADTGAALQWDDEAERYVVLQ